MSKIFIGGLNWNTTEQGLWDGFSKFGTVTDAKVVTDRETGRSRGFGFVTFSNSEEADNAINTMNGNVFEGRTLTVNKAQERPTRRSFPRNNTENHRSW